MTPGDARVLGQSAIRVRRIGLGCATFGREIDEETAFRIMDFAMESGITLFDTAEAYGGGQSRESRRQYLGVADEREVSGEMHSSEKIIGKWLESRCVRKEVVLLTKVFANFTRAHVKEALEASLQRLRSGCVDVYMFHKFDAATALDESVAAMDEAVKSGGARAAGCSNFTAPQLRATVEACRVGGFHCIDAIESNYNLAAPGIAQDLVPLCVRENIGVITYSPLSAGFLTGKYTGDRAAFPKGSRFDVVPGHADVYFSERNFRIVELLRAMAARVGVPAVRLAMGWVFQNHAVTSVLVGARTIGHLENALAALRMDFPPEWLTEMNGWE